MLLKQKFIQVTFFFLVLAEKFVTAKEKNSKRVCKYDIIPSSVQFLHFWQPFSYRELSALFSPTFF